MKSKYFLFFSIVFLGLALISLGAYTAEAGPVKLTYSNFFPTNPHSKQISGGLVPGS
jgi:hypothetical protein